MKNEKVFTNEEAKALRGTEFIYVWDDDDTIPAFIAEVDLDKGITCKALKRLTKQKYPVWTKSQEINDPKNYDNVTCVRTNDPDRITKIQDRLNQIVNTGKYLSVSGSGSPFGVSPTCSF